MNYLVYIAKIKKAIDSQATALEQARQAAVSAKEESLLLAGKYKEAQELRETERADLIAKAELETKRAKDALMQRDLSDVHSSILSGVFRTYVASSKGNVKSEHYNYIQ